MLKNYDVFISFKNGDGHGGFTEESKIAENLYHFLTKKGVTAFFSPFGLEALGRGQYSEAIDDVLDVSRFLVVVGSNKENLESKWVKYEWRSFLDDIRSGYKINSEIFVVYTGMSTTELPRALRYQQAFDVKEEDAFESLYAFLKNAGLAPTIDDSSENEMITTDEGVGLDFNQYIKQLDVVANTEGEPLVSDVIYEKSMNHVEFAEEEIEITNKENYNNNNGIIRTNTTENDSLSGNFYIESLDDYVVLAVGENLSGQCNVSEWDGIVAMSAGDAHTVGLRSDGTVIATGDNSKGQCNVSGWKDIIMIATGSFHTVGLTVDGNTIATGDNFWGQCKISGLSGVIAIFAGGYESVALKKDNFTHFTKEDFYSEEEFSKNKRGNVSEIAFSRNKSIMLFRDGRVTLIGKSKYNHKKGIVENWENIVAVSANGLYSGYDHILGLREDGKVLFLELGKSSNSQINKNEIEDWDNIMSISSGSNFIMGLKSDGTVITAGLGKTEQTLIADWDNIHVIAAGQKHVVALKGISSEDRYRIGLKYENVNSEEHNHEKAFRNFLKSAHGGSAEAMVKVGRYYELGQGGVDQSYEKAVDWYMKAHEHGNEWEKILSFW